MNLKESKLFKIVIQKENLPGLDLSGVPGSRISGTGTCTSPFGLPGGDNFCPTPTGLSALSPSPNVSLYKQVDKNSALA